MADTRTHTHTLDRFWDLKLVPKGVLLEVRVEVEKVEKVKSTEFKTAWMETRYSIEQEQKSTVSDCFGTGTHGWSIGASWDSYTHTTQSHKIYSAITQTRHNHNTKIVFPCLPPMRRFSTSICSDPIPRTHSRRGTTSNCSRCLSTRCRRSPKRIFFCLTCDQLCRYQSHRNGGALQKHQQDLMGLCTNGVLTSNSIRLSFAPSRLPFILGVNLPFQTHTKAKMAVRSLA